MTNTLELTNVTVTFKPITRSMKDKWTVLILKAKTKDIEDILAVMFEHSTFLKDFFIESVSNKSGDKARETSDFLEDISLVDDNDNQKLLLELFLYITNYGQSVEKKN